MNIAHIASELRLYDVQQWEIDRLINIIIHNQDNPTINLNVLIKNTLELYREKHKFESDDIENDVTKTYILNLLKSRGVDIS